jgi:transcriptional regulator with XRE-family HTH domain
VDAVTRRSSAFSKAFAAVVRSIRTEKGLSQYEVANRAGISSQYVGYIERELRCPTIEKLARLAIALETTATDLVERAEELAAAGRG